MSISRIAALATFVATAVPVFAQYDKNETPSTTPPTPTQAAPMPPDQVMQYRRAEDLLNDPNVHWTTKEKTALLMTAPYVRPRDLWEIDHMVMLMPSSAERVMYTALTNAIRANAGDYYQQRAAAMNYWMAYYKNPSTPPTPPMINTPSTTYTPAAGDTNTRTQPMVGADALYKGISDYAAYEFLRKGLDAGDRTTFDQYWNMMTTRQQDAMINIVRNSRYYFASLPAGVYYNPY